jgi:hypothetical protein
MMSTLPESACAGETLLLHGFEPHPVLSAKLLCLRRTHPFETNCYDYDGEWRGLRAHTLSQGEKSPPEINCLQQLELWLALE